MNAPPTIVVLNDYCHVQGGASKVAVDEAVSLAAMGQHVIFVGAVGPVCAQLKGAKLEVICLGQSELMQAAGKPGVMLQGLWNLKAHHQVRGILKPLDPARTVVHLHGYTKALTTSPVHAATGLGFRIVCTLHDFFTACPNGAFFDYQERQPCLRTAMSLDCITTHCDKRHYAHKVYRVARGAVQRGPGRLPRGVTEYITLSQSSAEILRMYLPKHAHYYALENIIEVPQAPPVNVAANNAIVAVGRLDIEKGIDVLVEACRQADLPLTLVGDGPLRPMAESYRKCRVTGWVEPGQVMAELEKARCLAFPSIWYETYGLVVSEAAGRGVPAIVSDISAAAERVVDGTTGWRMRSGDVADLMRCLELSRDDAVVKRMGQAAYDRFWANPPTREAHARGLMEIYGRVLA
jgi:glycosyltransferase involved in cell wall biosynthesis